MARIHDVARLIKSGYSPGEIERELQISFGSVKQYLFSSIGAGLIQGSEVIFSIPVDVRGIIEATIQETNSTNWFGVFKKAQANGHALDPDVLKLYLGFRNEMALMKDMYWYISNIEVVLHRAIKSVLVAKYGPELWWHDGIPLPIRTFCVSLKEQDTEFQHESYCYTTFIHLQEILDKKWPLFSTYLPNSAIKDKQRFLGYFTMLNQIRNKVMHPVKEFIPTEDEFILANEFYQNIQPSEWQRFPRAINQNTG
jgi:hypothetical protein